ncbi:hypothetical protein DFH07DRAFT_39849 [Mycena maculata]|uniref:Uncharacterized protein n=1 Tax=Mycena maculata TaxID=230809 RepID=A0AAD7IGT9_9AGAR|nr:hypothetical protein DFH07DRAFT_39849 [Mycena maculata]
MSSAAATAAALSEALFETLLYGAYGVLFAIVIYLFRRRHGIMEKRPVRGVLLGLIVQFITITVHWINGIYEVYFSFVHLGGGETIVAFYSDLSAPHAVLQITLFVICSLVADMLVIYRLYVIFSHRRNPVIFPLLLLVGQAISGGGVISVFATSNHANAFYSLANGWVTTSLVSSIVISVYSSAMISWKIWWARRALGGLSVHFIGGIRPMFFLAVLVESAALQTAASIALLAGFQIGFIAQQLVVQHLAPAIFGISTVLIHARIGLGWAYEPSGQSTSVDISARITFAAAPSDAYPSRGEEHALEVYPRK